MVWGALLFSDAVEDIQQAIASQYTVIALVDDQTRYQQYGIVTLGALLPPYEALAAEIDRNSELAQSIYIDYLNTTGSEYLAAILACLYSGKNVLLYLPADESMGFDFINTLAEYIRVMFGITVGTNGQPCSMTLESQTLANIANLMYGCDLIPFEHYCTLMPYGMFPSTTVIAKIMRSMNYRFQDMNQCCNFCMQYITSEKKDIENRHLGKPTCPAFRMDKP